MHSCKWSIKKPHPEVRQAAISKVPSLQGLDYSAVLVELAFEVQKADSSHRYCDYKPTVETGCAKEPETDASIEHTGESGSNEATNHPATAAGFAKIGHVKCTVVSGQ